MDMPTELTSMTQGDIAGLIGDDRRRLNKLLKGILAGVAEMMMPNNW